MSWGAVAGAAVSVVGGALANKGGASKKTTKLLPYNTGNLWGDVAFDPKKRTITQNYSDFSQGAIDQFQGMFGEYGADPRMALGRSIQGGAAADMLGAYGEANNYGMVDPALYSGAMGGMAGITGGMGNLFGAAANNPYALQQMGYGAELLGSNARSFEDVAAQRLNLLREGAAPYEERAQNSLFTKLYGMGQIGTPGGQLGMESFGKGLAMADNARQVDALNFADNLYGRELSNATALKGLGANMFGGGVSNYLSGINNAASIGRNTYDMFGGMYDLGVNYNNLGYNRATDKLSRTSSLFGFGSALEGIPLEYQGKFMNMLSGISGEGSNLAKLGIEAAGSNTTSGMQNPWQAAAGGMLSGIGAGLSQGGWGGLFGGGGGSSGGGGGGGLFGGGRGA